MIKFILVPETSDFLRKKVDSSFDFSKPCIEPDRLANDMITFMFEHRGVGLAAPQIGLSHNCFVMGLDSSTQFICFNPKIRKQSTEQVKINEGCLSFPGLFLSIKRPAWIIAEFQNEKGDTKVDRFDGILARCFQHELDHINGLTFTTRAGRTTLTLARHKRQQSRRRYVNE